MYPAVYPALYPALYPAVAHHRYIVLRYMYGGRKNIPGWGDARLSSIEC